MADRATHRRAALYRERARELAETAAHEPHDDRRRHMLDVAASYQCTADQMAPPQPQPDQQTTIGLPR